MAQEIGDAEGQAILQGNLSLAMGDQGDLTTAKQLLMDSLDFFQKGKNKLSISFLFSHLGTVSLKAGHPREAIDQAKTALTLRQELDMRLNATDDLATLAAAHEIVAEASQVLAGSKS